MTKPLWIALATVLVGCTDDTSEPFEVGETLVIPLDLALDEGTLYSLSYDGAIRATPIDGAPSWDVVAPIRPAPVGNEILVEPQGFNLVVDPPFIYWTAHVDGHAEIRRAALVTGQLANGMEVLDVSLQPFPDLARAGDRVCWSSTTRIACVDRGVRDVTTLVAARARPQSLIEAGGTLYWAEQGLLDAGSGALYSLDMTTKEVNDIVASLHEPTGVALSGDTLHWLDRGTCTDNGGGLCFPNRDASVHFVALDAARTVIVEHTGHVRFDSEDLVVSGDSIFYAADGAVWKNTRPFASETISDEACNALVATETTLYCGTSENGLANGHILAIPL